MKVLPLKTDRIYYLDFAKILTALLVIFGHFYSGFHPYCVFLFSFHVPLFYFISGIFHRNAGKVQWEKYVMTLLVPTVFFAILEGLIRLGGSLYFHSFDEDFIGYVKYLVLGLMKGKGIMGLWFLVALFWCKVFTDILITSRIPAFVAVFLGILGILSFLTNLTLPFLLSQALMGWPFYIIGFSAQKWLCNLQPNWKYLLLFIIFLGGTLILSRFNGKVSMMGVYFGKNPLWLGIPSFYVAGLVGIAMIFCLALLPIPETRFVKATAKSLITVVGSQGLFFYFVYHTIGFDRSLALTIPLSVLIYILCYLLHITIWPFLERVSRRVA